MLGSLLPLVLPINPADLIADGFDTPNTVRTSPCTFYRPMSECMTLQAPLMRLLGRCVLTTLWQERLSRWWCRQLLKHTRNCEITIVGLTTTRRFAPIQLVSIPWHEIFRDTPRLLAATCTAVANSARVFFLHL